MSRATPLRALMRRVLTIVALP